MTIFPGLSRAGCRTRRNGKNRSDNVGAERGRGTVKKFTHAGKLPLRVVEGPALVTGAA